MNKLTVLSGGIVLSLLGGPSLAVDVRFVPSKIRIPAQASRTEDAKGEFSLLEDLGPELSKLAFDQMKDEKVRFHFPDNKTLFVHGMPEVPRLSRAIALTNENEPRVRLSRVILEETDKSVPVVETPPLVVWSPFRELETEKRRLAARLFPGHWLDVRKASDVLHLNVMPIQVDRRSGKVYRLKEGRLEIAWEATSEKTAPEMVVKTDSVIISTPAMQPGALKLARYHRDYLGIESTVVTTEQIEKSENPIADSELPQGYATALDRNDYVLPYDRFRKTGYNWQLARKIITFTRKLMGSTKPKYVTLLGDVESIPPSYYFAEGPSLSQTYSVTDQCYAATNLCLDPRLAVGRLPFSSNAQVDLYLHKLDNWQEKVVAAPIELSLMGGKAFPADVYLGELGALYTLEKSTWSSVKKYFRTMGNYDRIALKDLITGKLKSTFVYHLDHGFGNQLTAESEYISSTDVADAMTELGTAVPPVVLSVSCANAAYDVDLVTEPIFPHPQSGKESIGVSMLRASAGAIAYLGVPRPATGAPVYQIDAKGNLHLSGTTESLQLMDTFLAKYERSRSGRIGDFLLQSLKAYAFENGNDMNDDVNRYSFWNIVLLGDPVLPLPGRRNTSINMGLPLASPAFDGASAGSIPHWKIGLEEKRTVGIPLLARGPVRATLIRQLFDPFGFNVGEKVVRSQRFLDVGRFDVELDGASSVASYFLRIENEQGVPSERQVWFEVVER